MPLAVLPFLRSALIHSFGTFKSSDGNNDYAIQIQVSDRVVVCSRLPVLSSCRRLRADSQHPVAHHAAGERLPADGVARQYTPARPPAVRPRLGAREHGAEPHDAGSEAQSRAGDRPAVAACRAAGQVLAQLPQMAHARSVRPVIRRLRPGYSENFVVAYHARLSD